jgi:hypothetical protein
MVSTKASNVSNDDKNQHNTIIFIIIGGVLLISLFIILIGFIFLNKKIRDRNIPPQPNIREVSHFENPIYDRTDIINTENLYPTIVPNNKPNRNDINNLDHRDNRKDEYLELDN